MTDCLGRLVDALTPGATPVSLRRLRGGLGNDMHLLRYETPSGERHTVVLRRYRTEWPNATMESAQHEFDVLGLLQQAGVASSLPLLLDADGAFFGCPAMVLSYVPGRSFIHHPDEAAWVDGLARGLVAVHTVTPQRFDMSWLRCLDAVREQLDEKRLLDALENSRADAEVGPLAQAAFETLEAHLDSIEPVPPCLVHDDYWPGNTIWYRGRLAAVIDWSNCGLGDPRADIAQCRADLVFSDSIATADAFLRCYQKAAPQPLPDMWYFDLLRGLRALLSYPKWLEGYHDAGMRHLELVEVGARINAFVRRALDEAP